MYLLLYFIVLGSLVISDCNVIKGNKRYTNIRKLPEKYRNKHHLSTVTETPAVTFVVPVVIPQEPGVEDNPTENEIEASTVITEVVSVDTQVNLTLDSADELNTPSTSRPLSTSISPNITQKLKFPCSCVQGQCGCCTGPILERINFKGCGNISFIPEEFVFDVRMTANNNTVVRRKVSVSDPPPICFNPRRAPFVEVCAELSNVHVKSNTAHACLEIEANVGGFPVYSRSFECFSLGPAGLKTGQDYKPIKTKGPKPVSLFPSEDDNDDDDGDDGIFGGADGDDGIFGGADGDDLLPDFGDDDGDGGDSGGGEEGGLFEASDLGAFADVFGGSRK